MHIVCCNITQPLTSNVHYTAKKKKQTSTVFKAAYATTNNAFSLFPFLTYIFLNFMVSLQFHKLNMKCIVLFRTCFIYFKCF